MSLRWRLAVILGTIVALGVVLAGVAAFVAARTELLDGIDAFLRGRATSVARELEPERRLPPRPVRIVDETETVVQLLDFTGEPVARAGEVIELPVSAREADVALLGNELVLRTVEVDGVRYRVATAPIRGGGAVQVARSLAETDEVLAGLRNRILLIAGVGAAAAALLGWLVARRLTRPIERLAGAAEHVAATQDLATPVPEGGRDEVGRLATTFNTMLTALATSRDQQRRLVEDAGHELRTPLTSLRTNVEVLRDLDRLEPSEREELLHDLSEELVELTDLVNELVVLARDPGSTEADPEDVRLDEVAEVVAARARRRSGRPIDVTARPTIVRGSRPLIERAVANLVDNAVKFSPDGSAVEIAVADGRLVVRDHGPGIAPSDRPHVFERFYRAPSARSVRGSGLGLSIVEQVVTGHGGQVEVGEAPGGGAVVGFQLPVAQGTG